MTTSEQTTDGPALTERFVTHDGVRIRYFDTGPADSADPPVVFVPGILDAGEDYRESFAAFGDRRVLLVELRGRGGSGAPPEGYSAGEQATDVIAVLDENQLGRFHLMTFSRGTTPALEVALQRPEQVLTVSIGDYLPAEIALSADGIEKMWAATWRGTPTSSRAQRHVLDGIQSASKPRELWTDLAALGVPVLVARRSEGGIVNDAQERKYREAVPGVEVVTIAGTGHDLMRPSRSDYPNVVLEFINRRQPTN